VRQKTKRNHMTGKILIWLLATFLLTTARPADAQQRKNAPRIGFLSVGTASAMSTRVEAFRRGLREQGYLEGRDIVVDYRYAEDNLERLREFAAELVRLKVDIIVTGGPISTRAGKETAGATPIVMAYEGDPVGSGLVTSLARPGGNITGLTSSAGELNGKRLELLKEAIPKLSRVAVIRNPGMSTAAQALKDAQIAAQSLKLTIQPLEVQGPNDLEGVFAAAKKARAEGMIVVGDPVTFTHRRRVADLALKNRIATIHGQIQFAEAGAMMVYGPNDADMFRRAATYVDKILKGAKPGDLPIERPVKFDFIINLKTAKQLGLAIPPNVLARANRVIR
jgi:putative tryptophan/tyrosine transport system substrate-binding protein